MDSFIGQLPSIVLFINSLKVIMLTGGGIDDHIDHLFSSEDIIKVSQGLVVHISSLDVVNFFDGVL